ncbi:MAG: hypothetical protein AAFR81_06760 [Chloroflexota bacterium]
MESATPSETSASRESGTALHQRETRWQIYLPFMLGIGILLCIFFALGFQPDAVWRDRVQAIGDFLYTWLCALPILVCLFPVYLILVMSIYGMRKLHAGTATPLVKVENLANSLASRIESATDYVNEKTVSARSQIAPLEQLFSFFDRPAPDNPTAASDSAQSNKPLNTSNEEASK